MHPLKGKFVRIDSTKFTPELKLSPYHKILGLITLVQYIKQQGVQVDVEPRHLVSRILIILTTSSYGGSFQCAL